MWYWGIRTPTLGLGLHLSTITDQRSISHYPSQPSASLYPWPSLTSDQFDSRRVLDAVQMRSLSPDVTLTTGPPTTAMNDSMTAYCVICGGGGVTNGVSMRNREPYTSTNGGPSPPTLCENIGNVCVHLRSATGALSDLCISHFLGWVILRKFPHI